MQTLLILLLVAAMVAVVISLIRGIVAFLQSTKMDLDNPAEEGRVSEMQMKQNKAMFARIKYQAVAVVIVAVLLSIAS